MSLILVHFTHLLINTYVNISTVFLNTQEVYDFIEKILLYFFHGEVCTESVDDGFAAAFGKIYFDAKAKTFFGNKNSRIIVALFENTEGLEIFVFM